MQLDLLLTGPDASVQHLSEYLHQNIPFPLFVAGPVALSGLIFALFSKRFAPGNNFDEHKTVK